MRIDRKACDSMSGLAYNPSLEGTRSETWSCVEWNRGTCADEGDSAKDELAGSV